MSFIAKVVDSGHYHLWTDVLHARALASQAANKWDRGAYVRWTIIIGWTVLEIACREALQDESISRSFRRGVDAAVARLGLAPIDWGSGVWQRVGSLHATRNRYVHRFLESQDLFPHVDVANDAVEVIRSGAAAVADLVGRPRPDWLQDDADRGWSTRTDYAHATRIWAGVDVDDGDTLRLAYVCDDREHTSDIMPPGTDYKAEIEALLANARVPIREIRVYRGCDLIEAFETGMRGT